ncbi:MAG: hypothetical protein Q8Q67_01710 [bacterium]|nr:hypothetical protein [bacterium]
MRENFGIKDAQEMGAVNNEALDRHNLKPQDQDFIKDEVRDEDDKRVTENDPNNTYVDIRDVADPNADYLSYGEGGEENKKEGEDEEANFEASTMSNEELLLTSVDEFDVKELNPENKGIIGAASVSAEEGKIYVNREEGESKEMSEVDVVESLDRKVLVEEYAHLEGVAIEDQHAEIKDYKTQGHENLKTMPDRKKERGLRSLIRSIIKPGSN